MTETETAIIRYQRELFASLEEFFQRATGQKASQFARGRTFSEAVKQETASLANRGRDAFPWADKEIRRLQARKGPGVFKAAGEVGGFKLVLGGSGRFLGTHLDSIRRTLLYADTILIPDTMMPWLETPREEERFRHVLFLEAVFYLLQLKPLVDADLPFPPIAVFPSFEKSLEKNDPQTREALLQLVADVIAYNVDPGLQSFEDVSRFVNTHPDQFLTAVEQRDLFVSPGGAVGEPLVTALQHYRDEVSVWRSPDWQGKFKMLSPAQVVLNGISERLAPQYHLLENSNELHSHPLLCVEQQAHYYKLVVQTGTQRLTNLALLDERTTMLVEAFSSRKLRWLSQVPIGALVELRRNNENAGFRQRLDMAISRLHEATLDELNRVVAEVLHEISVLIGDHEKELREIQSKYARIHGETAVVGWIGLAAMLVPWLAPFLGTVAPLGLGMKYARDKIAEASEKKKLSKTLMGVLSLAYERSREGSTAKS